MGEYGPASSQVEQLIDRAGRVTLAEAADYYAEHAILFGLGGQPLRGNAAIRDYLTSVSPGRRVRKIERQVARVEGLDGALGPHRHEGGGLEGAVGS